MPNAVADSLLTTIQKWRPILLALDDETAKFKPSADRWSIAEVIGHLIDSACNNHQRFVRAQQTNALSSPNYDQRVWVRAGNYHGSDWPSLVEFWCLYQQHVANLISNIPASQTSTPCTIATDAPCTLQFLVDDYLVHLQHHLDKISERLGK